MIQYNTNSMSDESNLKERKQPNDVALVNPINTGFMFTEEQLDLLVEASASTGIKSKGEALLVFQKAKELGIGAANAISHIHVVNGKSGIGIHIIKAILSKPSSGVSWKLIKDYEPIYNYTDGTVIISGNDLPSKHKVVHGIANNPDVDKYKREGYYVVAKVPKIVNNIKTYEPVDYITEYEFTRTKRNIKGEWATITVTSSFSWSEALKAGLPLSKDGTISPHSNWTKYTKLMLATRAFTFGARDIADDLLLGCSETSELMEINDIPYTITDNELEEGKVTILDSK